MGRVIVLGGGLVHHWRGRSVSFLFVMASARTGLDALDILLALCSPIWMLHHSHLTVYCTYSPKSVVAA